MSEKKIVIALAGNPNSGKTTLFNALTGSNQYVGNWPGVTVEKKEGKLKKHPNVIIEDLPGIYSLSPYTPEEIVSRNYLIQNKPDAILNIVDGTNLERNLYLTTQLLEIGLPMVIAVNMMDLVRKNGDVIRLDQLSAKLGCPMVEISALKEDGIQQAVEKVLEIANNHPHQLEHRYSGPVEHAIAHIEENALQQYGEQDKRWYAIKLFERDEKVIEQLQIDQNTLEKLDEVIGLAEKEMDDDSESIITNERYLYISEILEGSYRKKQAGEMSTSDKIDAIVTNKWLGLPIFAVVMFLVYFVSIQTVGTAATDWVNDGLFGDGWFWFGQGRAEFDGDMEQFDFDSQAKDGFVIAAEEKGYLQQVTDGEDVQIQILDEKAIASFTTMVEIHNADGEVVEDKNVTYQDFQMYESLEEPDPKDYGPWQDGLPVMLSNVLEQMEIVEWLSSLILDGILAGVGAVLGFLPQMLVLFFFLAFLEGCGYMARIAFVMDRLFRKFGLSGKSFIPMLVGTGCSVPGIMATRTIENETDRRMTAITTSFIPCSAKLPVIALIAGAFFNNNGMVATASYFIGIMSIVVSGIMLKKVKMFAGDPAPFVMELPAYHWPTIGNIYRSMYERASGFIKKAGTVILLATILVWFTSSFGFMDGQFGMVDQEYSLLAYAGNAIKFIFTPLGFGDWRATVATLTGLVAKENVVGTMGVLYGTQNVAENGWQIYTEMYNAFANNQIAGFTFLVFNLLCAPCFAAIGAIRKEMSNYKLTLFAVTYQCVWAFVVSLIIYQYGMAIFGQPNIIGLGFATLGLCGIIFQLVRKAPQKEGE